MIDVVMGSEREAMEEEVEYYYLVNGDS